MSEALHEAIWQVPEGEWEAYGESHAEEIRGVCGDQLCARGKSEHKDSSPCGMWRFGLGPGRRHCLVTAVSRILRL